MKRKNTSAEKSRIGLLLLPGAALLLLIVALAVGSKGPWRLIFSGLSFLVSAFALREELLTALRTKDIRSGLLLLVIAGLICFCTGRASYAALALLLRLLGGLLLPRLRRSVLNMLDTRRELNPLKDQLPKAREEALLVHGHEHFLNNYLPYVMLLAAAIVAALSTVLGNVSASEAVSRAAVVLALGGTFPLFSAFPLSDYAAAISSGESGVLFRRYTLTRLMGLKLACARTTEPVVIGTAAVFPARPEAVGPELMLRMAATAYADTVFDASDKLAAVSKNTSSTDIQR